jgi:hypothetical protein
MLTPDLKEYPVARKALATGVPWTLVPSSESTILNSTPYTCDWECFSASFADEPRRLLLSELEHIIEEAVASGIRPRFLMVGGSFLQPDRTPGDLDCVIFYEVDDCAAVGQTIKDSKAKSKERQVDARWVPIDGDPFVAIRSAVFFATLYSRGRRRLMSELRGVVFVLLSKT